MFSTAERAAILSEARKNADAPRHLQRQFVEPPVPDRNAEWRREAEEIAARKEAAQLTDSIGTRIVDLFYQRLEELRAEFEQRLADQRQFIFDVVTGVLGEIKGELLDKITEEVGQLRADMNIDKAFANAKVIDLPNVLPARKAAQ
jgi:hypothetical protein